MHIHWGQVVGPVGPLSASVYEFPACTAFRHPGNCAESWLVGIQRPSAWVRRPVSDAHLRRDPSNRWVPAAPRGALSGSPDP